VLYRQICQLGESFEEARLGILMCGLKSLAIGPGGLLRLSEFLSYGFSDLRMLKRAFDFGMERSIRRRNIRLISGSLGLGYVRLFNAVVIRGRLSLIFASRFASISSATSLRCAASYSSRSH
jgi:hypothetical protein